MAEDFGIKIDEMEKQVAAMLVADGVGEEFAKKTTAELMKHVRSLHNGMVLSARARAKVGTEIRALDMLSVLWECFILDKAMKMQMYEQAVKAAEKSQEEHLANCEHCRERLRPANKA